MADFDPYMELPQPQNGFSEEELKHLIALLRIEGVGPVMAKNLIAHCQSAQAVFQQPKGWLERVPQAGDKLAEALRSGAPLQAAEQELERARANDLQILTYIDERYPEPLKTIFDAPLILFKQGTLDFSAQPNVAIVGTRKPTAYGKRLAAEFAGALAELGVNITSGLAYGIDYTAHTTALERGGLTTAVLGHGLHYIYPAQHKKLAHQMRDQGGALLTEYFWGQNAKAKHFPQRNRILSGLSEGIIVIEAGERGGALITARLGFDQNREVFAIPGSLEMPYSAGCNNLIRDNVAKLVTGPEDVLIELGLDQPAQSQAQQQAGRQLALQQPATNGNSSSNSPPAPGQERPKYKPVTVSLSAPEQKVLNQLEQEPALLDQLVERTGISAGELMSILLTLEFKGLVQQLPGRKFIRC